MYEIVYTAASHDPLDQLLEAEATAAYQWDCELDADSPIQNREEFIRNNAQRRAQL